MSAISSQGILSDSGEKVLLNHCTKTLRARSAILDIIGLIMDDLLLLTNSSRCLLLAKLLFLAKD